MATHYSAYKLGKLLGHGEVPVPSEILDEATEIRWADSDPSVPNPIRHHQAHKKFDDLTPEEIAAITTSEHPDQPAMR